MRTTQAGMIHDLGKLEIWERFTRNGIAAGFGVRSEDMAQDKFTVHARVSNGTAGSRVKYTVAYKVDELGNNGYAVTYSPLERGTYQQGLI